MSGTRYQLEVNPRLPERLTRLNELANNLWYSWDRPTRELFARLNSRLWRAVGHSPKAFLKRVDQRQLDEAAENPEYLSSLARVLSAFDSYHAPEQESVASMGEGDLIAYFCAEFGFHESMPIYSGGLGILAGDHCKTASDLNLPFVGIGLLYRQGYFLQTIDGEGRQAAVYHDTDFDDLPIEPVCNDLGSELHVMIDLPGRQVSVKVWKVRVGRITLYLLDTDIDQNTPRDRNIAHQLYGGDRTTRIEQEILLGVGGARALQAMGLTPTVWHINEGHAAFMIVERMRELVAQGLGFAAALEAVACNTVFTTHTAVPAGHDHFSEEMIREYFTGCARDMGCDIDALLALGREKGQREFNMTALAIRGSRHHNGVSRIHGKVSAQICSGLWPQVEADDNPMNYITNGIHVPTFLSELWRDTFNRVLGPGWYQNLCDDRTWEGVQAMPDHLFWSTRQSIKAQMLHLVRYRIGVQNARNHGSKAHLDRVLRLADPDNPNVLVVGFARRVATYKRATLLFQNLDWLRRIISDPARPVVFIFAGKAHPADEPGQALIRRITEIGAMPEFEGHILMVEDYDLHMGRRMVAGVDVWLNNPIYPLEASGTSGMKAAINGVINLSVLDGWWGEGYAPGNGHSANGWAIKPVASDYNDERRDREEARTLYEILQDKVLPLYYAHGPMGFSPGWVAMAKRSIMTVAPSFNSERMVKQYVSKLYLPASRQWSRYSADGLLPDRAESLTELVSQQWNQPGAGGFANASQLAGWKQRIHAAWAGVALRRLGLPRHRVEFGDTLRFEAAVHLNGLSPDDVAVELLLSRPGLDKQPPRCIRLVHQGSADHGDDLYTLELTPDICGKIEYRIRAYPHHELLSHPFEMGLMVWL